jgi:hypothetical protein|tara:strand:- start:272 stop:436 length:165 start_codon:yes stop_codon:yes gene_type:complete
LINRYTLSLEVLDYRRLTINVSQIGKVYLVFIVVGCSDIAGYKGSFETSRGEVR